MEGEIYYIYWTEIDNYENFLIGELRNECSWRFKYNLCGLDKAREKGFKLIPDFPRKEIIYTSDILWPFFSKRMGMLGGNPRVNPNGRKETDYFTILKGSNYEVENSITR